MMQFFVEQKGDFNVWIEDNEYEEKPIIVIELENGADIKEADKVPEETSLFLSIEQVRYLHSYLETFLKIRNGNI